MSRSENTVQEKHLATLTTENLRLYDIDEAVLNLAQLTLEEDKYDVVIKNLVKCVLGKREYSKLNRKNDISEFWLTANNYLATPATLATLVSKRKEEMYALLQGQHKRLGKESKVGMLPEDIMATILRNSTKNLFTQFVQKDKNHIFTKDDKKKIIGSLFLVAKKEAVPRGAFKELCDAINKNSPSEKIEKIIQKGVNVNAFDKRGRGLLRLASYSDEKNHRSRMIKLLLNHGATRGMNNVLFNCAQFLDKEVVTALLDKGATTKDIEKKEGSATVLLRVIAHRHNESKEARANRLEITKQLITHQAVEINKFGRDGDIGTYGETPLAYSVRSRDIESTKLLLESPEISIDAPSKRGNTALSYCFFMQPKDALAKEIAKLLIQKGANTKNFLSESHLQGMSPENIDWMEKIITEIESEIKEESIKQEINKPTRVEQSSNSNNDALPPEDQEKPNTSPRNNEGNKRKKPDSLLNQGGGR